MKFSELTQVALLGTERQSLALTAGESEQDRLLAQLDGSRREETLLSAAAITSFYEEAGQGPARDTAPAPEICAPEAAPVMNERAGALLARLLEGEYAELLPDCLVRAALAGQIALPEILPRILDVGVAKAELREALLPLLGRRGRWLAPQNPAWAWVAGALGDDESVWHVGEGPARRLFLQRLRRTNPKRARELLSTTWKEETAEDRADFIALLYAGLSLEDESFLETGLADKRKEVRRSAADLLVQLPDSALVRRMVDRAQSRLKFTPSQPPVLEIMLPTECDQAMQQDGIEPKPPPGCGEKIWWLMQILKAVPLALWTTEWQVAPGEIIAASLAGEWQLEMFAAWTRAAMLQKNANWAEALLVIAFPAKRLENLEGLLATLPAPRREFLVAAWLTAADSPLREARGTLLAQCRHDWSPEFSRSVLTWLRQTITEPTADWQLRNQFKDFAARMAVATLPEAMIGWLVSDSAGGEFWSKGVDEFLAVAEFRAALHAAFSPLSPPASPSP